MKKTTWTRLLTCTCLTILSAPLYAQPPAELVDNVLAQFETGRKQVTEQRTRQRAELAASFEQALLTHREAIVKQGDSETVLKLDALIQQLKANPAVLKRPPPEAQDPMAPMIESYLAKQEPLNQGWARDMNRLVGLTEAALTTLQKKWISEGLINQAVIARGAIQKVKQHPDVRQAAAPRVSPPKRPLNSEPSPPVQRAEQAQPVESPPREL